MKKRIRIAVLLVLTLAVLCSCKAEETTLKVKSIDYDGLTELTAAEPDEETIKNWPASYKNPYWDYICHLTVSGDNLVVSNNHARQQAYLMHVDYGYFVGAKIGSHYDTGFVMYYPAFWTINDEVYQAELPPKLVAAEQCRGFVEVDGQPLIYLFTNESFYTGKSYVYEIRLTDSEYHWEWERICELPSLPIAYNLDNENKIIYIVTEDELLAFSFEDYSFTTLADLSLWHNSATSMVRLDDKLYIGMRMGIYEYDLTTTETEWYPMDYSKYVS